MLRVSETPPARVLMTVDAVGGVWRYALDLARGLRGLGTEVVFAGFGPAPEAAQRAEAEGVADLRWTGLPLDWMVEDASALADVPGAIARLAAQTRADLVQVNLPSQAAGLATDRPVAAVSHSCIVTWFRVVKGGEPPEAWGWQRRLNAEGLARADAVAAPSASHAELMRRCYGLDAVEVVPNAVREAPTAARKQPLAYAAGRWWDEGKNAATLDAAAARARWPIHALGALEGPQGQTAAFRHARAAGPRSHAELRRLAGTAGAFVSPSVYEPFGLAALEAAQAGAALVLADIPTYRELWEGAALFAPPHDPDAFAAALDRLAKDPALRDRLGATAQARAADFAPERQAQAMQAVYARALRAAAPREAV
jgi:glycosyltransferase involved in cell wall biosynthesis